MAGDRAKFGEGFSARVVRRRRLIGWGTVAALVFGGGGGLYQYATGPTTTVLSEPLGAREGLRVGGHLVAIGYTKGCADGADVAKALVRFGERQRVLPSRVDADPCQVRGATYRPNTIVNAGETALRDCFNNDTGTECADVVKVLKYHGLGTSSSAVAETQTGCQTELTTQYAVDSTRPTGTQTTNGANVYRTVGTNTVDAGVTIEEFCLMSAASAGTMWTRILTGTLVLASSDTLETTYDLTIE